jgi:hypothetical protein
LGVGDRFIGGQLRAFGPCGLKVLLAHCLSQPRNCGLVTVLVHAETNFARALPYGCCRAEEPRRFLMTSGLGGEAGEAFDGIGPDLGCIAI